MEKKRSIFDKLMSVLSNDKKCSCLKSSPKFGRREGNCLRCDECGGLFELPDWVLHEPSKDLKAN